MIVIVIGSAQCILVLVFEDTNQIIEDLIAQWYDVRLGYRYSGAILLRANTKGSVFLSLLDAQLHCPSFPTAHATVNRPWPPRRPRLPLRQRRACMHRERLSNRRALRQGRQCACWPALRVPPNLSPCPSRRGPISTPSSSRTVCSYPTCNRPGSPVNINTHTHTHTYTDT